MENDLTAPFAGVLMCSTVNAVVAENAQSNCVWVADYRWALKLGLKTQ